MTQGSTETENETHALGCSAARERDPSASSQVTVAEDRRFELLRGCPNTLSNNAGQRSPASAAVRDLPKHDLGEHRRTVRTGANETETETEGQAALYGAARLRSDVW